MKEEKVGLSGLEWFLSLLGIIFFASLIVIPPVFRSVFKEEEVVEDKVEEKEYMTTGELICNNPNIIGTNYNDSEVLIIKYENNDIISYTSRLERVYTDPDIYQIEKENYGRYVSAFTNIEGYDYSVNLTDDTLTALVVSLYDYKTFLPTTMNVDGIEELVAIKNHQFISDKLDTTKETLTSNSYVCEISNEQKIEVAK